MYSTDKFKVSFPKWRADPAVSFYNELDTIAATDGTTDEVSGLVYKTAGITRVSNELRGDSDPSIGDLVGGRYPTRSPVRSMPPTWRIRPPRDQTGCWPSRTPPWIPVPASRISIVQARFASVAAGSEQLTHWIVKPAAAEALSKLKDAVGLGSVA